MRTFQFVQVCVESEKWREHLLERCVVRVSLGCDFLQFTQLHRVLSASLQWCLQYTHELHLLLCLACLRTRGCGEVHVGPWKEVMVLVFPLVRVCVIGVCVCVCMCVRVRKKKRIMGVCVCVWGVCGFVCMFYVYVWCMCVNVHVCMCVCV
jgi:hypothetical protein